MVSNYNKSIGMPMDLLHQGEFSICPFFIDFLKAFQSFCQFAYILCYNVLYDFRVSRDVGMLWRAVP